MSNELKMKDKDVVVPGDVIAEGMSHLPGDGTYREDKTVYASRLGLLSVEGKVLKTVPLAAPYVPKEGDRVIGRVVDILFSGWRVDLLGAYSAVLGVKDATKEFIKRGADLTEYFELGDLIIGKITNVTSQNLIDLSLRGKGLRKLENGRLIKVDPAKVPRIIGKGGSMVGMINEATGVDIAVGQNGLVWFNGDPEKELIAVEAVNKIEAQAHLSGLTDTIKSFLDSSLKGGN